LAFNRLDQDSGESSRTPVVSAARDSATHRRHIRSHPGERPFSCTIYRGYLLIRMEVA
ncbi:hypothetical protein GOODEAATRI_022554, partial [Goodea atripinnis]